jgi:hypothetical protein
VIYARVSTDDQIKGTSLHGQVVRCRTAAATGGWNVVGEFVDEGVSGALSRRPQLDAIVRLVEDQPVDVVAITKLDRIARALRHSRVGLSSVQTLEGWDSASALSRASRGATVGVTGAKLAVDPRLDQGLADDPGSPGWVRPGQRSCQ